MTNNVDWSQFILDSHIPVPEDDTRGRPLIYPFKIMVVGQSLFVPGDKRKQTLINQSASQYGKRNNKKFVTRTNRIEDGVEGVRVWRKE